MASRTAPDFEESVFINCPFDKAYLRSFHATVFTVHDCGYIARCSLEINDASQIRVTKILRLIAGCRLGIHDISRTEVDKTSKLPRFNMPLELGMFLAAKEFGTGVQKKKVCLILDRERYRFQKFISDIAGQDICAHNCVERNLIGVTRNFLRTARPHMMIPGGALIFSRYSAFLTQLPALCSAAGLDAASLIFNDYSNLVSAWLKKHP